MGIGNIPFPSFTRLLTSDRVVVPGPSYVLRFAPLVASDLHDTAFPSTVSRTLFTRHWFLTFGHYADCQQRTRCSGRGHVSLGERGVRRFSELSLRFFDAFSFHPRKSSDIVFRQTDAEELIYFPDSMSTDETATIAGGGLRLKASF
jgi:hypothetical protein